MTSTSADKKYGNAFLDACESGNLSQIHEAIASGQLTPYFRNEGLFLAVAHGIRPGYKDVVAALLAAGASITPWVRNALHGDSMEQDPTVIRLLLDHGLDPNATQSADFESADSLTQTGGEPLLSFISDPACAREFLSRGTDPNATGSRGETALYCALESSNVEMAELLVEYGARLEPNFLFTTIRLRWRGPDTGIRELMTKFLLDKGVDPNQATSAEWGTPLHLAVFYANADIVKMLLDAGADRTKLSTGRRYHGLTPEQLILTRNGEGPLWDKWHAVISLLQS
ncbi:ankyrin repeat-containing domain protein [Leptodontidium sp. MPI-SDFR-AT-0119]|nr:ankyrin repeat-containing domain protein [Leptodontidium sp. MPI-SDFR-AT-0119]